MENQQTEQKTIEERLTEIEAVIASLESGKLDLNDSLKAFEKGVSLIRESNAALNEASEKLKVLTDDGELNGI